MHSSSLSPSDVTLAQGGDAAAFTRLVDATRGVVGAITLAIVRDPQASQDVAQEVFLEAWATMRTLRNPESFLPWIRQVSRNLAHEHLRKSGRFGRRHATWEANAEIVADERVSAAEALLDEERCRVLRDALEALPEETREVVTLYYREDRSAQQVGLLLDLSEEAVKKRLQRARATLAQALAERFDEIVRATAPGAAFSAAVAAAVVGSSSTASAATAGVAAAKASVLGGGAIALLGPSAGAAGGVIGVRLGMKRAIKNAYDDRERDELRAFARKASVVIVLGEVIFAVAALLGVAGVRREWIAAYVTIDYVALVGVLAHLYLRRLPRILARGRAARLAADPTVEAQLRREDRGRLAGVLIGALCGATGLVVGLYFLLR